MVTLGKYFSNGREKLNFNDIKAQICKKILSYCWLEKKRKLKSSGIFLIYNNKPNKLYI